MNTTPHTKAGALATKHGPAMLKLAARPGGISPSEYRAISGVTIEQQASINKWVRSRCYPHGKSSYVRYYATEEQARREAQPDPMLDRLLELAARPEGFSRQDASDLGLASREVAYALQRGQRAGLIVQSQDFTKTRPMRFYATQAQCDADAERRKTPAPAKQYTPIPSRATLAADLPVVRPKHVKVQRLPGFEGRQWITGDVPSVFGAMKPGEYLPTQTHLSEVYR